MTIKASDKLPYDAWFDDNPLKGTKYIEEPVVVIKNEHY